MEPIILASESPRRRAFLELLGLPFVCVPAMIDETPEPGLGAREVALDLARKKALAIDGAPEGAGGAFGGRLVLAADTVVALEGGIFGKPASREEAARMLALFSGRRHEVITAIALRDLRDGGIDLRAVECAVDFARLSGAEIDWYLDTGEWRGAAGGYRLQEKGACLIERVLGSPSAVAGLPLRELFVMLRAGPRGLLI
ncbi:MAG: Maf family protein [Treponema sp.]|nr:Maf family protein [Treponema sp.]